MTDPRDDAPTPSQPVDRPERADPGGTDTGGADTSGADTSGTDTGRADTGPAAPSGRPGTGWRERRTAAAKELRSASFLRGAVVGAVVAAVVALLAPAVVPLARGGDTGTGPLVILSGRDDSVGEQRKKLVEEWNKVHPPDQQARIEELPPRADDQHAEMVARAQAESPRVDVYNLDVTWTAEFAEAGWIRRLDESQVPTEEFLTGPLATCRYDGELYALPFNADVGLLYYRTDLLERIGQDNQPPQDWAALDQQVAAVRALPEFADRQPPFPGYVGQLADYEGLTVTALEAVWGERGTVVDDDGGVLPDGDDDMQAVVAGLRRLRAVSPSDRAGLFETESTQRFRDGQALFMRNWPLANRQLQQPGEAPAPPFAVTQLPGSAGALGGQNLAVSSRTTRPRAANALVAFLTGDRSQQVLFERGGLPATRRVVYQDPLYEKDTFAQTLSTALDRARPRPAVPRYTEFSTAFRGAVGDYLRDPSTLREDTLRANLEAALDGKLPPDG